MSQNIALLTLTVAATAAITANRFVAQDGSQANADAFTLGVARNDAAIGDNLPVDVLGTAIVQTGGAVAVGDTLKSNASGQAIKWVTSGAKVAVAREAAAGAGETIEVLLIPNAA